jgi:nucleotide-binding universal stress UspA family protein
MDDPTILVPIDVSEPSAAAPDPGFVELLHPLRVVLLGYYPVPDQAAPEQLRDEYEAEATERLERTAEPFADREGDVEAVVVFTRDRSTSVDRLATEYDCDAVLSPGGFERVRRVLVPLRGDPIIERIVSFVGELLRESDTTVTLYHALAPGEDPTESEFILRGAADRLAEDGLDRDRIAWEQSESESPVSGIVSLAETHDIVVIGESEPSLRDRILGDVANNVIERIEGPVLVVRRRGD